MSLHLSVRTTPPDTTMPTGCEHAEERGTSRLRPRPHPALPQQLPEGGLRKAFPHLPGTAARPPTSLSPPSPSTGELQSHCALLAPPEPCRARGWAGGACAGPVLASRRSPQRKALLQPPWKVTGVFNIDVLRGETFWDVTVLLNVTEHLVLPDRPNGEQGQYG